MLLNRSWADTTHQFTASYS